MDRAAMAVALAALAVGGYGAWAGMGARENARRAEASLAARPDPGPELRDRMQALEADVAALRAALDEARTRSDALAARVDAAEAAVAAAGSAAGTASERSGGGEGAAATATGGRPRADTVLKREWLELAKKVLGDEPATAEEQQRFWKLVKGEGFMEGLLADLEAAVAANPKDIDARMTLSQGYISKLFTVPPGPEMGTWASKAEGEWKSVIALDDKHWEARASLATSYLHYPEFLNKTSDAITEFEKVRRLQEAELPPGPKQAQVYTSLATLYQRLGNKGKAREALEAGSRRFPDDAAIRDTLTKMGD